MGWRFPELLCWTPAQTCSPQVPMAWCWYWVCCSRCLHRVDGRVRWARHNSKTAWKLAVADRVNTADLSDRRQQEAGCRGPIPACPHLMKSDKSGRNSVRILAVSRRCPRKQNRHYNEVGPGSDRYLISGNLGIPEPVGCRSGRQLFAVDRLKMVATFTK